eukprot:scaffold25907_cov60-Attheya_sp.AAC.2
MDYFLSGFACAIYFWICDESHELFKFASKDHEVGRPEFSFRSYLVAVWPPAGASSRRPPVGTYRGSRRLPKQSSSTSRKFQRYLNDFKCLADVAKTYH